jgi:hypothetical protein
LGLFGLIVCYWLNFTFKVTRGSVGHLAEAVAGLGVCGAGFSLPWMTEVIPTRDIMQISLLVNIQDMSKMTR